MDFRRTSISVRKDKGLTIRETDKQFCIRKASLARYLKRLATKNSTPPYRKGDKYSLEKDMEQHPDA